MTEKEKEPCGTVAQNATTHSENTAKTPLNLNIINKS